MKKMIALVLALTLVFALTACGAGGGAEKNVTIRLSYLPESGTAEDMAAKSFKEYVEKASGGSITVNLYPGGQLGSETQMAEQCRLGTTEMIAVGEIEAVNTCPEYATIMRVPYMFDSYEHLDAYLNSPMGDTGKTIMDINLERSGMRVLGYYDRGSRQLTCTKPVYSVADLEGLAIRVPEVAIQVAAWKETGAVPTAISAGELYMSLSQGLVSAQENPVDFIKGYALNEVQDYIMHTNHNYGMRWIYINETFYKGLTEDQKKIVDEGAAVYVKAGNDNIHAAEEEAWKYLGENGMTVIETADIDIDSIKSAIMANIDELSKDWDPCCIEIANATRP